MVFNDRRTRRNKQEISIGPQQANQPFVHVEVWNLQQRNEKWTSNCKKGQKKVLIGLHTYVILYDVVQARLREDGKRKLKGNVSSQTERSNDMTFEKTQ